MNDSIQAAVNSGKIEQFVADDIRNGLLIHNGTRLLTLEYALEDDSWRIIDIVIAFAVLQCFFVGMFYYSRIKFRQIHGWDIWLMVPAFLTCFAHIVLCIIFVRFAGLGRHCEIVPPVKKTRFLKLTVIISFFNPTAVTLPRLCIVCLYLRVFSAKLFRYASFAIAGFLIAAWIAVTAVQIRMCVPFSKQWMPEQTGTCLNQFKVYIWFGPPSILTDLMMIVLPLPVIWRLQTSRIQKIGLTVTFLAGGIGIVTSIIRFTVFSQILTGRNIDLTYRSINVILWTAVEPCVYLIASTLPSLRPLINSALKDIHPSTLRSPFERLKRFNLCRKVGGGNRDGGPNHAVTISLHGGAFSRMGEDTWPENFMGTQSGLATCCRESFVEEGAEGDLGLQRVARERGSVGLGVIVVHKEYKISTEPAIHDIEEECIVRK